MWPPRLMSEVMVSLPYMPSWLGASPLNDLCSHIVTHVKNTPTNSFYIPYLLMQDEVYYLNLVLKCEVVFAYEVPNQTAANRIALSWTIRSQTKVCITKSRVLYSSEILCSTEW